MCRVPNSLTNRYVKKKIKEKHRLGKTRRGVSNCVQEGELNLELKKIAETKG